MGYERGGTTLPGPRAPRIVQSALFLSRPVEFLARARRRHGDCFGLRLLVFGDVAYVADPVEIKRIFTGDAATFHAGEANTIMRPLVGSRSVLTSDEDDHMRRRRALLAPFHGDAVRAYERTVREVTERAVDAWPLREPFAVRPSMQAITLDVILRAVVGVRDEARLDELRRLLPPITEIPIVETMLGGSFPGLVASPAGRALPAMRAARRADELLHDEIRRRRAEEPGPDVLSMLVPGTGDDRELRDQLMTLLLAGHETTTTGLAWTFERLVRHPAVLRRLRDAVDAGEDAYVDAVAHEALRVRPVIMDVARKVTADVTVAGHRVRAGSLVMPAIALVHEDGTVYDDPQAFRPERFLDRKPGTYTWIPFGGGVRRCVGAAFALMEMRTVLKTVIERVDLATTRAPGERARVRHVTLVPARGGRIAVAARRSRPPLTASVAGPVRSQAR